MQYEYCCIVFHTCDLWVRSQIARTVTQCIHGWTTRCEILASLLKSTSTWCADGRRSRLYYERYSSSAVQLKQQSTAAVRTAFRVLVLGFSSFELLMLMRSLDPSLQKCLGTAVPTALEPTAPPAWHQPVLLENLLF